MKRIIITISFLAAAVFQAAAQDIGGLFDEFAQKADKEYAEFMDEANNMFADLIKDSWKAFNILAGIDPPAKPKPKTPPVAPADTVPESVELPEPQIPATTDQATQPDVKPVEDSPAPLPVFPPENANLFKCSFYGVATPFTIPKDIIEYQIKGNSEKAISDFWKFIASVDYDSLIEQTKTVKRRLGLNGWTLYQWINIMSDFAFGSDINKSEIFKVFMLNQLGLEAKLAIADGSITTMVAFKEMVYSRMFCKINDNRYFLYPELKNVKELYSYDINFPVQTTPVTLEMTSELNLTDEAGTSDAIVTVNANSKVFGDRFALPINQNIIRLYADYPQVDVEIYAKSFVDPCFAEALLAAIRPHLEGKNELEQVNTLLSYLHYDFEYATDDEQFGYEKPFFMEENYVYPKNDCEDRSILFSFLVRNLLHLDVVLLDYPDHIATAICFSNDVPGDYFYCNGKKYTVCDPTYIGACAGMTMDGYQNQEFGVKFLGR